MGKVLSAANRDFKEYRVVARQAQGSAITSFTLALASGCPVPAYKPGQHLVFRLNIDGVQVLRNYSVSGDPSDPHALRIAVKREPAPAGLPLAPPGLGSNYLHDHVREGDVLTAAGPMGDFYLDESSDRPVVLLSGGVGLTPMVCMLHRLVRDTRRTVHFIHACEHGDVHAFGDEVNALAQSREGVYVHFCYRQPTEHDIQAGLFHSTGLLSKAQLQALLPLDDYDFYLCGPSGFMQANWRALRSLGVPENRIQYEFFGPATVLEANDDVRPAMPAALTGAASPHTAAVGRADSHVAKATAAPAPLLASATEDGQVRFLPTDTAVEWDESCASLLELAESAGLSPDFNCRAGLCNTCMSSLVSGEVEYFEPPLDDVPEGQVLLCCSRPVGGPVIIGLKT
jgi:ferredoxin-NADP reductase/ferredoxin